MPHHLSDRRAAFRSAGFRRFLAIARAESGEGIHPAVRTLFARRPTRTGTSRLAAFLRVQRGWTA
jgi:hypothetical protein